MPTQYQGISGKVYFVQEQKIAGGGEGAIHEICGDITQVAKIFKPDKRNGQREEKLRLMVEQKLSLEQQKQVTWPQDVIYDQNGFAGYVMPRLQNTDPLVSIYNSGDNGFDLRYRVLAAINLCYAVKTVHDMGAVCGDLNPQNICINLNKNDRQNGMKVTLVDTDSYHVQKGNQLYRCEVGLGDFIAPELQKKMTGANLKSIPLPTYTRETDLFALAVHIFTLLMNGCHPFACAKTANGTVANNMSQMTNKYSNDSVVAPQPLENIKDGFFPFSQYRKGIQIPVYAPEFSSLPQHIQLLFVRTFVDGYTNPQKRVSEDEWIEALKTTQFQSQQCSVGSGKFEEHFYFAHNDKCPICSINERIIRTMQANQQPVMPEQKEDDLAKRFENQWNGNYFQQTQKKVQTPPKQKIARKPSTANLFLSLCGFIELIAIAILFYQNYQYGIIIDDIILMLFNGVSAVCCFVASLSIDKFQNKTAGIMLILLGVFKLICYGLLYHHSFHRLLYGIFAIVIGVLIINSFNKLKRPNALGVVSMVGFLLVGLRYTDYDYFWFYFYDVDSVLWSIVRCLEFGECILFVVFIYCICHWLANPYEKTY